MEEALLRFAKRTQTVDQEHPLVRRIPTSTIARGRGVGQARRPRTKLQRAAALLFPVPRPKLVHPHYTTGCRLDPTQGVDKKEAAAAFKEWWGKLPPTDVTVFSDGSEQWVDGEHKVGYGYAIYQDGKLLGSGSGGICEISHVFDAEAIGAWKGLERATSSTFPRHQRIHMCIDSTSVIRCIQGNASDSSQWAFLNCQEAMQSFDVHIRWSPGHMRIEGNEEADRLADIGALGPIDTGPASQPTVSGLGTEVRKLRDEAQQRWWAGALGKLSGEYRSWELPYEVKPLPELHLSRRALHQLVAIRTGHGDFAAYHRRYHHEEARLTCSCGRIKTTGHIVFCRKTQSRFERWPQRPPLPPGNAKEGRAYLSLLMRSPKDFKKLLDVTGFYSTICPPGQITLGPQYTPSPSPSPSSPPPSSLPLIQISIRAAPDNMRSSAPN